MTLFDIDSKIRQFLDSLYSAADSDGTIDDADFKELEALQAEKNTKVENIALYIKELEIEASALKAEADKLKARAEVATNKADRLRRYLKDSLWADNAERLKTSKDKTVFESTRCKLSFRRSESLVIDESLLPKKYYAKKITEAPDKTLIKELIKSGKHIKGAELRENQSLQIK